MPFTRNFLKSMGLSEEQSSAAIEEHNNVTKYLQSQIDQYKAEAEKYKADAEKLSTVEKERDELKARKDYQADYDQIKKEFDDYKAQVAQEAETAKKKAAYRKLLKDEQISDDWADDIVQFTKFDEMKLDDSGSLQDTDALKKNIGEKYAKYKVTFRQRGEDVAHPPFSDMGQPTGSIREMGAKRRAARYGEIPNTQNKQ